MQDRPTLVWVANLAGLELHTPMALARTPQKPTIIVRDRKGAEVARFEGYYYPEWLPNGRLLMLGSPCRRAGVWVADRSPRPPTRADGNQVATPAKFPAVSRDGCRVALVWNNQLWTLTLDS